MSTITGTTINSGITLSTSGNYASPLTITATGAVEAASGNAIYGPASQAWTVQNQGTITAPSYGVDLLLGGYVGNSASGLIKASMGVHIQGATGTVSNSGTILSTVGVGVGLNAGGSVANTSTGLIAASGGGVFIGGAAGTVTNSGTIVGTGTPGHGVEHYAGGSVANTGTGLIQGHFTGVEIGLAAGTVINSATIAATGTSGYSVRMRYGGSVANTGTGLIEGYGGVYIRKHAGTVTNSGTIAGAAMGALGYGGTGVFLVAGGSVDNTGTGLIQAGYSGVYINHNAGTVTNSGTIIGTGTGADGIGVVLTASGTVVDSGTISGAGARRSASAGPAAICWSWSTATSSPAPSSAAVPRERPTRSSWPAAPVPRWL